MIARQSSWMPPRKRTMTISVVIPLGAEDGSTMRSTSWTRRLTNETATTTIASPVIRSSGA